MTARISLIPGKTRGHRPRLQMLLHAVAEALRYTVRLRASSQWRWHACKMGGTDPNQFEAVIVGSRIPEPFIHFRFAVWVRLGYTDWSDPLNRMAI